MNCKNYCDKEGNCSRCGECCASTLPLTKEEEIIIREYIKKHNVKPEFFQKEKDINLQCCFYDRTNRMCKIYDVRPNICRVFKCNKDLVTIKQERDKIQKNAYWNKINNNKSMNLTDMRLLFYDDPRSLIGCLIYDITNGTMQCSKKQFELIKKILMKTGQGELARSIKEEYDEKRD